MSLRGRVVVELGSLTAATVLFLWLFPERPMAVDVGLALFALALIAASTPYTRRAIWERFPPAGGKPDPARAWRVVLAVTAAAVLALAVVGAALGWHESGPTGVTARLGQVGVLPAAAVYFAWALLQQTLFQFYLLGRLRVVFAGRPWAAIALTGCAYSLVHLPDVRVTAVTAVAGIFWCWAYDRYRTLLPLAVSHAVLGAAFYTWVYGKNLAGAWLGL